MLTVREIVGTFAVVTGAALLAGLTHHAGGQGMHARRAVQSAAGRLTYGEISAAWTQAEAGDGRGLDALAHGVALPYRAAHQEGDAVVLTFASQEGACVDLVARPGRNTVRTRSGC